MTERILAAGIVSTSQGPDAAGGARAPEILFLFFIVSHKLRYEGHRGI